MSAPTERPLKGTKAIADYLDVSTRTVERWCLLDVDPLPVFQLGRRNEAMPSALDDWRKRNRRHVAAVASGRVESDRPVIRRRKAA